MRMVRIVLIVAAIVVATSAFAGPGPCKDCVTGYDGIPTCVLVTGDSWGCTNTVDGCDINWIYCPVGPPQNYQVVSVEVVHDRALKASTEQLASAERSARSTSTASTLK